eukprot:TRINITY_DN4689_c0_g1_i1.p1 TRINITY_DN4689_c0_g1~~TRINITY_DN4689_c0_g1_i1.p1  ORF type:complete len:1184 (+),score=265.11 TRINITY_DN4689_c0_g1_i1:124-3552(+)
MPKRKRDSTDPELPPPAKAAAAAEAIDADRPSSPIDADRPSSPIDVDADYSGSVARPSAVCAAVAGAASLFAAVWRRRVRADSGRVLLAPPEGGPHFPVYTDYHLGTVSRQRRNQKNNRWGRLKTAYLRLQRRVSHKRVRQWLAEVRLPLIPTRIAAVAHESAWELPQHESESWEELPPPRGRCQSRLGERTKRQVEPPVPVRTDTRDPNTVLSEHNLSRFVLDPSGCGGRGELDGNDATLLKQYADAQKRWRADQRRWAVRRDRKRCWDDNVVLYDPADSGQSFSSVDMLNSCSTWSLRRYDLCTTLRSSSPDRGREAAEEDVVQGVRRCRPKRPRLYGAPESASGASTWRQDHFERLSNPLLAQGEALPGGRSGLTARDVAVWTMYHVELPAAAQQALQSAQAARYAAITAALPRDPVCGADFAGRTLKADKRPYLLSQRIGAGRRCDIYQAAPAGGQRRRHAWAKVEPALAAGVGAHTMQGTLLNHEAKVLHALRVRDEHSRRVPVLLASPALHGGNVVLFHELLGPTLAQLLALCGGQFQHDTVIALGAQVLQCIEHAHRRGWIHRDIRPTHFAMGLGREAGHLFLCEFGQAKRVTAGAPKGEINPSRRIPGSMRYCSVGALAGYEAAPQDDLESAMYMLAALSCGSLPWDQIKRGHAGEQLKDRAAYHKAKAETPVARICAHCPVPVAKGLQYIRSLPRDAKPDYSLLRGLFLGHLPADAQLEWRAAGLYDGSGEWPWVPRSAPAPAAAAQRDPPRDSLWAHAAPPRPDRPVARGAAGAAAAAARARIVKQLKMRGRRIASVQKWSALQIVHHHQRLGQSQMRKDGLAHSAAAAPQSKMPAKKDSALIGALLKAANGQLPPGRLRSSKTLSGRKQRPSGRYPRKPRARQPVLQISTVKSGSCDSTAWADHPLVATLRAAAEAVREAHPGRARRVQRWADIIKCELLTGRSVRAEMDSTAGESRAALVQQADREIRWALSKAAERGVCLPGADRARLEVEAVLSGGRQAALPPDGPGLGRLGEGRFAPEPSPLLTGEHHRPPTEPIRRGGLSHPAFAPPPLTDRPFGTQRPLSRDGGGRLWRPPPQLPTTPAFAPAGFGVAVAGTPRGLPLPPAELQRQTLGLPAFNPAPRPPRLPPP